MEFYLILACEFVRVFTNGSYLDLGMGAWFGVLLGGKEFFEEFLAIAKSRELYLHTFGSREGYHAFSKIDNLDGFSHVEDVNLSTIAHGTCFEHKAASLGDEHEVADNVGMGDLDRTALLDLLLEDWYHATVTAKDVAETSSDELGLWVLNVLKVRVVLKGSVGNGSIKSLTVDLADALGAAHYVGWIDGFVGGDHDELLGAILHGKVSYYARTINVVLYGFGWIILHHRHMLVGSSMEDVLWPVFGEDFLHAVFFTNRGNDGLHTEVFVVISHIEAHIVHWSFRLIDKDEFSRLELGHLTCHL